MNKQQLLELIKVNLRYVNPQMTDKARRSGKNGKKLTRYLVTQYLLVGLIFIVLYGLIMLMTDFSRMPGFFTYYVALFGIIGLSQGITVIYNLFFESQDIPAYLPLPFRQTEIFLSKLLVVAMTIVPYTLPILVVAILAGIQAGVFFVLAVISGCLLFVLFMSLIFGLCSFMVFGLTRTKMFKRHKKVVTSLLLILSMSVAVMGILIMNTQPTSGDMIGQDRGVIPFLMPLYYLSVSPFSLRGLLSLLGLCLLTIGLYYLIKLTLMPKFYEQLLDASPGVTNERRKHKKNQNLRQILTSYNFQLFRDPNLIMQLFSSCFMFPMVFIVTFGVSGQLNLSFVTTRYLGVVFFAGAAFSLLVSSPISCAGTIISLDKENFLFIRSLPLSMKTYLKAKFHFALAIQLVLTCLTLLVASWVFHLPLIHLPALLLGNLAGSYLLTLRYFVRDYRLLDLTWTNVSQLFTRGAGSWGFVFVLFGGMLISGVFLVLYAFGVARYSPWVLDFPLFLLFFAGLTIAITYYQRKFWRRFF